jgi:Fe-S oxidoreductase/nitrate reductase gamma subunit
MLTPLEKVFLILIILATATAFFIPVLVKIKIILAGQPEPRFSSLFKRFLEALSKVFLQRCTLKNERVWTGLMHVLIFYGALTFDTFTINHTLEGFIPHFYLFGRTGFGLLFSFMVDIFSILVLIGIGFLAFRRFIIRPPAYETTRADSAVIYLLITAATLSFLYFESFSIAYHPETQRWAFLGGLLSSFIQKANLSPALIAQHFKISWWVHLLVVYGFIAYVPHSKYFHMFAGPVNVFFNNKQAMSSLRHLDIEHSEVFGLEKATDFTWKDLLDAFACVECGRCQDACPAFATEKALSPKMIVYNLRLHLLKNKKDIIRRQREALPSLMADPFTADEIWSCTTCGACMHVCPVEIEHIPKLVGLRQGEVLMEGRFPPELNSFFRNLETNSNPWGIGFADRANWAEGLGVKTLAEHPEAEYLFWAGCALSFDDAGKKIARALVKIFQAAGVDFAILGEEEKCCGDSAKRLGNEYLYQLLAQENLMNFAKYKVKKIIVGCPHGYNTLKNEYPRLLSLLPDISAEDKELLESIEVIHHTQFIEQLVSSGRLKLKQPFTGRIIAHDSCYLSRHNQIKTEPRTILKWLSQNQATLLEAENSGEHTFCCGAGGGLMWTEETQGTRINRQRTSELLSYQPEVVITFCPFCQTMLTDGLKDEGQEEIKVLDVAQLLEELVEI